MATLIYLIRHGQTEYNRDQLIQGWYNSQLTEAGIELAQQDGKGLRYVPFDAAYASDLDRARDTARYILADNVYLSPDQLQLDPGLREVCFGSNAGAYSPEMKKLIQATLDKKDVADTPLDQLRGYIDEIKNYDPTGQAENFAEFTDRIDQTMTRIADRHDGEILLLVSHGMFIRTFYTTHFAREEAYPSLSNGALSRLSYEKGKWQFLSYNEEI